MRFFNLHLYYQFSSQKHSKGFSFLSKAMLNFSFLLLLLQFTLTFCYSDNLCSTYRGKECCHGWKKDFLGRCTIPICDGNCGSGGECVGPNLCYCSSGVIQYSCGVFPSITRSAGCPKQCQNGGVCTDAKCKCSFGYTGEFCEKVACPNDCSGRGNCLSQGYCQCEDGFSGLACDISVKGPCYTSISRGVCSTKLTDQLLTREQCCNSLGQAWGHQCQRCSLSSCGFARIHHLSTCVDMDFCSLPGICKGGKCLKTGYNAIRCECPPHTTYNSSTYLCEKSQDVCASKNGVCGVGGDCKNTGNSFECECKSGYELTTNRQFCSETFNICSAFGQAVCNAGLCVPTANGYFTCICDPGYELDTSQTTCIKTKHNQCQQNVNLCSNGVCVEDGDTYKCLCKNGYEASSNKKECVKQTYCSVNPNVCRNGACVAVEDFYYCRCNVGFKPSRSGLDCMADAEEHVPIPTVKPTFRVEIEVPQSICDRQKTCTYGGECVPITDNEYLCICKENYTPSGDARSCHPQQQSDSPTVYHKPCDIQNTCQNGSCHNVDATSYECLCNSGFSQSADKKSCVIQVQNYCQDRSYLCFNGHCVPSGQDDYYCSCNKGYKVSSDWRSCIKSENKAVEFNPCTALSICGNGHCQNLGNNAFQCVCNFGYKLSADKQSCIKQTMCESQRNLCMNGICVSRSDTDYHCECNSQYQASPDGKYCFKTTTTTTLAPIFKSTITPQKGGFQVLFSKTYCQKFAYVCGQGLCLDMGGSHDFECRCFNGYTVTTDNRFCVKQGTEETGYCRRHPTICNGKGRCSNTFINGIEGFKCNCYPGFKARDTSLQICDEFDFNTLTNHVIIHGPQDKYPQLKPPPQLDFDVDGYISVEEKKPDSNHALLMGSKLCDIKDEVCENGWCEESGLSYQCQCFAGYRQTPDKKHCIDIDECAENKNRCLMGTCINQKGTFTCNCNPGFEMNIFKICKDINECQRNASLCPNAKCNNLWGDFECECLPGYTQVDKGRKLCVLDSKYGTPVENPGVSIQGSAEVVHAGCPHCRYGCVGGRPDLCTCTMYNEIMLASSLCVPSEAVYLKKTTLAAGFNIFFYLPRRYDLSSTSMNVASRKEELLHCSVQREDALFNLVRCDIRTK